MRKMCLFFCENKLSIKYLDFSGKNLKGLFFRFFYIISSRCEVIRTYSIELLSDFTKCMLM